MTATKVKYPSAIVLEVAVAVPLRRVFEYRYAPRGGFDDAQEMENLIGRRVLVSFGRGKKVGVVCAVKSKPAYTEAQLKQVLALLDDMPLFDEALWETMRWVSDYYLIPVGEAMTLALPVALRMNKPTAPSTQKTWRLSNAAKLTQLADLNRAPLQQIILKKLENQTQLSARDFANETRSWRQAVQSLVRKGWLREYDSVPEPEPGKNSAEIASIVLNAQQQSAVDAILAKNSTKQFHCHLLHGVTGSGKTEVYFQLMDAVLRQGKQVLFLVPEIGLTPQTIVRIQQRFKYEVALFHSDLNETERHIAWWRAKQGEARIVVGTRSAVYASLPNLGMIVVDEEHDASYKQQQGAYYQARDVAVFRAKKANVPIVLGSATPSLESFYNAQKKRYHYSFLAQRATQVALPKIDLVDINKEHCQDGVSTLLLTEIERTLHKKKQVMLFLNRRGFAPVLYCADCKSGARCRRCDAFLTVHKRANHLQCHHCGAQAQMHTNCRSCTSENLVFLGEGTQRLQEVIVERFPDAKVVRIDRDTTRKKGEMQRLLRTIEQREADIILGTQLMSKGHDFTHLGLVGVLNADQGLYSTDYRARESLFQQLLQVAGRAGRHGEAGRVLIQTAFPENTFFSYVKSQNYIDFAESMLAERRQSFSPPFCYFALLRCESVQFNQGLRFLHALKSHLKEEVSVMVMDAIAAPMEKRAGRYRYQLLIRAEQRQDLHRYLAHILEQVQQPSVAKIARTVRWKIDVDPYDLC